MASWKNKSAKNKMSAGIAIGIGMGVATGVAVGNTQNN